jgi:hypothetical protein
METEAPVNKGRDDNSVLAYLLKDSQGRLYHAECVDITDNGLIFQVDKELVKDGTFAESTLDSRYFKEMGLTIMIVLPPPNLLQ